MIDKSFWKNKRVFITGHTGFKGSWLCMWLHLLGAKVTGYALTPPTNPSLFETCNIDKLVTSVIGDIRDGENLTRVMVSSKPEIAIHMAAQPLVRDSYKNPIETYAINVMGTVNFLEAVRKCGTVKVAINVTTDKCYENKEWCWGYRENESLGGYDPYSNSKACSELITSSYRNSFFNPSDYEKHSVAIATVRAGNVIGGGDWAADRLIPDCLRALVNKEKVIIRNPKAIRPWQHVLEPLSGYITLAEKLHKEGPKYSEGWNFGPNDDDAKAVDWIVEKLCSKWGDNSGYQLDKGPHPHEAHYLKLDCTKANIKLGWKPKWQLEQALDKIIEWTKAYTSNSNMYEFCLQQINEYCA